MVIYFIIWAAIATGFAYGTRAIARSKGLPDYWFWIGFFGTGVALIVAACQPDQRHYTYSNDDNRSYLGSGGYSYGSTSNAADSTQWKCPKCGKYNPKYIGTCDCGCSYDAYLRLEEQRKKTEEENKKKSLEEDKKKVETENKEFSDKYNQFNLSGMQEYAIKVIKKEEGLTLADICRRIPRSTNVNEFKEALDSLHEKQLIYKDENEKYYLAVVEDKTENKSSSLENQTESKEENSGDNIEKTSDNSGNIKRNSETSATFDKYDEIRKYKELLDEGIITEEDFNLKKKELLGL